MQEVDLNYYSERRWRSRIPDEGDDLVKSCEVMSCHVMSCHVMSSQVLVFNCMVIIGITCMQAACNEGIVLE